MRAFRVVLLSTLATFLALLNLQAVAATKQDAQEIVEKASAFARANGKDKLISEVNTKDGQFHKGDLYVFVYDLSGTLIADPINKNLIGQNNLEKPDVEGKLFRKEFVETAQTKGAGWVDYKFNNPVSGKVEPKAAYVKKAGDIIIIAGVYLK